MNTRGFTIWELLLILVIIVIIAAVVWPIFTPARDSSSKNFCPSNEKQLGLAIFQYAQDNDSLMPNISDAPASLNTWRVMLEPYTQTKGIFQCSARRDHAPGPDGYPRSYAANYSGNYNGGPLDKGNGAFAGPGSKPLSMNGFKAPAQLIALCEVAGSNTPEFNIDDAVRFGPNKHLLWAAHKGGGNYLFADGHVRWLRPVDTQRLWYRDTARPLSANGLEILKEAQARASR